MKVAGDQNVPKGEEQMILVGKLFLFAWVPLGHKVFFGQPSR